MVAATQENTVVKAQCVLFSVYASRTGDDLALKIEGQTGWCQVTREERVQVIDSKGDDRLLRWRKLV